MNINNIKRTLVKTVAVGVLLLVITVLIAPETATVNAQQSQYCTDPIKTGAWCYGQTTATNRQQTYQFYGRTGERVSIRMEKSTTSLDPYLELRDPYGYTVAADDDSLANSNSLIDNYRLSSSGRYTIIARSYNNATYGKFWLYTTKL